MYSQFKPVIGFKVPVFEEYVLEDMIARIKKIIAFYHNPNASINVYSDLTTESGSSGSASTSISSEESSSNDASYGKKKMFVVLKPPTTDGSFENIFMRKNIISEPEYEQDSDVSYQYSDSSESEEDNLFHRLINSKYPSEMEARIFWNYLEYQKRKLPQKKDAKSQAQYEQILIFYSLTARFFDKHLPDYSDAYLQFPEALGKLRKQDLPEYCKLPPDAPDKAVAIMEVLKKRFGNNARCYIHIKDFLTRLQQCKTNLDVNTLYNTCRQNLEQGFSEISPPPYAIFFRQQHNLLLELDNVLMSANANYNKLKGKI